MLTFVLALVAAIAGTAIAALFVERARHTRELAALRRELDARVAERTQTLEARTHELATTGELRNRFFARVSHEIRTPLGALLGVLQLLLDTGLQGRQRELAEIAHAQGGTLLGILNDILDYSKMQAGRFGLAPTDFSLRATIEDAARVFGEQARAKQIGLSVTIEPSLPDAVHGDSVRLRQVLDNLLSNAVKFTDTGSIALRVTAVPADPSVVAARIEVADTGIGVGADAARVLFQPFMQADAATATRQGGTGLGLAIAKSLVELMGGEIGCRAQPHGGSTFWFTVKLQPASSAPAHSAPTAPEVLGPSTLESGAPRRQVRVLLAEDNAINRMVNVELLERAGCRVDVAIDGADAVAACAREVYDLVLMDCRMPGLDGYAATRAIRQAEGGRSPVPVVALTAHAVDEEAARCIAAGMDDCVTKPLDEITLARVLAEWTTSTAVVSAETLDDLERRSPAVLRTVIDHYSTGIPTDMAQLATAVARGDRERVHAMAHDLAGSALVVGARRLAALLREAESGGETMALDVWLARVDIEHRRVLDVLNQRSRRATSASHC
jgi:signal transduction histidine kinase/CheY-like chemotaxis protein/HPt (histidine-containing phosphotransfer) domain-containing protein